MTETAVENNLCAECGADIRPEALFCYNCGSAVADEGQSVEGISDAWFREDIAKEEESENGSPVESEKEITKPEEADASSADGESDNDVALQTKPKPKIRRKPKMKSAATLRKNNPKSLTRKNVEVVWEENEDSPNIWFILASVVIVLIVGVLFYLARILQ